MKKLIAVLIALAMVLSMSVMSFASFNGKKSPADFCSNADEYNQAIADGGSVKTEIENQGIYTDANGNLMSWDDAWTAYYNYVLANASADPTTAASEIVNSVTGGFVAPGDAITKVGEAAMGGVGGDGATGDMSGVVSDIIDQITGGETEPEISTEDYVDELVAMINNGDDVKTITAKIGEDFASGKIVANQLPDIAKEISKRVESGEIENNETVQKILDFIKGLGGGSDSEDTSFPGFGDITLPSDEGNSESGNFLDVILGIIGSIGDLFNPDAGDEPADEPTTDPNEPDPFGGETGGGENDPFQDNDTGDVSFVAVAAVAAVAGAALVLTRKKNNDAE